MIIVKINNFFLCQDQKLYKSLLINFLYYFAIKYLKVENFVNKFYFIKYDILSIETIITT